jgi:hypothetical protein
VVVRQDRSHKGCPLPFPDVLATKPPVVLLDSWADVMIFMDGLAMEADIADRRRRLAAWSDEWWTSVAHKLEAAVMQVGNSGPDPFQWKPPVASSKAVKPVQSKTERLAELAASVAVRPDVLLRWDRRVRATPASPCGLPPAVILADALRSHSLIGTYPLYALIGASPSAVRRSLLRSANDASLMRTSPGMP